MVWRILVLLLLICTSIGILGFYLYRSSNGTLTATSLTETITNLPTKAGIQLLPFSDLTIPGLRKQNYPGSQIQIEDKLGRQGNYIRYRASYLSDGLKIYGLLTVPNGEPPAGGWPAIVFLHGYIPPREYKTTERYVAYVDNLARNNFVVFKIDYRGHDQSEGEPSGAYFGSGYVSDALNAVSSLQQYSGVNPENIGLWGHSMSGNVVLRSMVVNKNIKAGVIWGGAVYSYQDLFKYGIQDNSYVRPPSSPSTSTTPGASSRPSRQNIIDAVGEFSSENVFWKEMAPTNFLDAEMGAVAVHHAVNDGTVSIEYVRDLKPLLEASGTQHEVFEYAGGGHDIESPYFSTAMNRTVAFFEKYLQ